MKKLLFVLMFVVLASTASGQQMPTLSTYTYNLMTVNPAYAGYHQNLDIAMAFTKAVPFIDGGSQFGNFTVNGPVGIKSIGLGGMITSDRIGVYNHTEISMAYSYKLFSRNKNSYTNWGFYPKVLSFGLQAGIHHIKENLTELGVYQDPEYDSDINEFAPSIGMGIFYSEKNFYVGLSAPRLMGSVFSSNDEIELQNHYYFQSGYSGALGKNYFIKPGVLIKYITGAPIQFDANLVFQYQNKVEWGVGYRSLAAINFLLGLHLSDHVFLVYHFDASFEGDNPWGNLHGLMIKFNPVY